MTLSPNRAARVPFTGHFHLGNGTTSRSSLFTSDDLIAPRYHTSRGMTPRRIKWAAIAACWAVFGLYQTLQTIYRSSLTPNPWPWWLSALLEYYYAALWFGMTPIVLRLASRWPLEGKRWPRHMLFHLAAMFLFAISVTLVFDAVAYPILQPEKPYFSWTRIVRMFPSVFDYGMLLYWIVVLIYTASVFYHRYRDEQQRAVELQGQLAQAQLQALKMQLQPHFLFNTLNTISALVHEDPDAADRMIVRLGELLRISLDSVGVQEVPLRKELEFLHRYLDIEKERFDDRLRVDFQVAPETLEAKVPNLILQPLVENALRHGLSPLERGGRLWIEAQHDENSLHLHITDDGTGFRGGPEGVGLRNTRARLRRLYGNDYQFVLRNRPQGGTEAEMIIPLRWEKHAETASAHRG
jgi:two-component system, LytTR family, sensor kinase